MYNHRKPQGNATPDPKPTPGDTAQAAVVGHLRTHGRQSFLEIMDWARYALPAGTRWCPEQRKRLHAVLAAAAEAGLVERTVDGVGRPMYRATPPRVLGAPVHKRGQKALPMCGACGRPGHGWCGAAQRPAPAPQLPALPPVEASKWLTAKEAAALLGCSLTAFYGYARNGMIQSSAIPKRFHRRAVEALRGKKAARGRKAVAA